MSIYQKRWSSVGSGASPSSSITRNTPTATNVLNSGVEPSTVGTSWNSVRWNKPSTSYRASLASRFENNSSTSNSSYTPQRSSRFLSSAAKNAADVASIGPSVSARASRFDTTNMENKEKYRNEARELITKWSSRERNSNIANTYRSPAPRSTFRSTDSLSASGPTPASTYSNTAYRTSTSLTPTRPVAAPPTTASRYSSERASLLSPSPTPILHTTPKAERPWRQRMAESSRIRSTLGDDVSEAYTARRARHASSRRSSLSQDELSSYEPTRVPSYSSLVQQPYSVSVPFLESSIQNNMSSIESSRYVYPNEMLQFQYRSRQSSVESSVFSPSTRFTNASSYVPYSYRNRSDDPPTIRSSILDRSTSRSKSPKRDSLPSRTPSIAPKNPSIRESSKERDSEKQKKKSVKERTARRNSRQNSQQDSSSDEEINKLMRSRSGSQVRRKPKKKSQMETEKLIVVDQKDTLMNRSMQSSLYETGAEDSALIQSLTSQINESLTALAVAAESEGFQSCAASPLAPSISRSSSKNGVVKNQIISLLFSIVAVLHIHFFQDHHHSLKCSDCHVVIQRQYRIELDEETHDGQLTNDDFEVSESSRIDDESQYSAVAHFKPNKVKRLAPVPGLWKSGAENEEFISRNKRFAKSVSPSVESCMRLENPRGEAEKIFALKRLEKLSKTIKAPEKKKPVVLKTKVEPKPEPVKPVEKKAAIAPKVEKEKPKEVQKPASPATTKKAAVQIPEKQKEVAKPIAPPTLAKPKADAAVVAKPKTTPQTPETPPSPKTQTVPKAGEKPKETIPEKPKPSASPLSAKNTVQKVDEKTKEPVKSPTTVKPKASPVVATEETPKATAVKPTREKVSKPIENKEPEKVKIQTVTEPQKSEAEKPVAPVTVPVVEKPKEAPKEIVAPVPGIEKKKALLKKKKIIPLEDEKKKVEEVEQKPKVLSEQKIEISKVFSKKSWGSQKTEKVLKSRNNGKGISMRCKSAGNEILDWTEMYRRKPQEERATNQQSFCLQVLVDTPILDVNYSTVKISLREKRKRVEKPVDVAVSAPLPPSLPAVIPFESENMSRSVSVASRASDTRASIILDEMRGTEAAVEWTRDLDDDDDDLVDYNGILVLPDKSILEQYISRKRGKIDRYRGLRPSSMCSYASSSCASPCPSTVSELCLPSSVLVHEPRRRAQYSAEPMDHCVTPVSLNSTPRGFTTKKEPPPVIKPVPFEAPKTLFEKMIQDQANRNRTTAANSERGSFSSSSKSQEPGNKPAHTLTNSRDKYVCSHEHQTF
ncbi:Protein CBG14951 [Caenorhabditis briggsae]|uniref:Protein CBG14951 n=1 Tax=Caenorhabditis briggsae TaxID=6238 RepID=A8XL30_CAEBR|nr:Protein CBG14951 [Caenorhabditis briggsae]CAP33354.2 Protein CBG14951 [Caenorhabditis briggsae]